MVNSAINRRKNYTVRTAWLKPQLSKTVRYGYDGVKRAFIRENPREIKADDRKMASAYTDNVRISFVGLLFLLTSLFLHFLGKNHNIEPQILFLKLIGKIW